MLIPNQDTILALAAVAAKNPEATVLVGINGALENLRAVDKKLREKLLVLMMAKEEGWPAAKKLQRRLNGEYVNPHVAKVLEEQEKQREKEKKNKEKEKSRAGNNRFILTLKILMMG